MFNLNVHSELQNFKTSNFMPTGLHNSITQIMDPQHMGVVK